MTRHEEFKTIMTEPPLRLAEGGIAPYSEEELAICMRTNGSYTSGFNIFRIQWTYSTCPSMPLSTSSARCLIGLVRCWLADQVSRGKLRKMWTHCMDFVRS